MSVLLLLYLLNPLFLNLSLGGAREGEELLTTNCYLLEIYLYYI